EEDRTWQTVPGQLTGEMISTNFLRSYMPVAAAGRTDEPADAGKLASLPGDRPYYVSVLPDTGYTLGGAPVKPGQSEVTVTVNKLPLPTAQISVLVFEDNYPINNVIDQPEEKGLEGFRVILEDPGGRYGQIGGQNTRDAFGNPLGTTYDKDGNVLQLGSGAITTDANGYALIKYLNPGKYGVTIAPPEHTNWVQTSTIEGTKVIDAWVKAKEPPYFTEFGPVGEHVQFGFIKPTNDTTMLTGSTTLSGTIVNMHNSRPPSYVMYNGKPFKHTKCWVGLNSPGAGTGRGIYAQACNEDGTFAIPKVPTGSHQLVVWDDALDLIFATFEVNVDETGHCSTPNGSCDLLEVPVFQWFGRLESKVFFDRNENGFLDSDEVGIPNVVLNLRHRDGSMYQTASTDANGDAQFNEVFPFFAWLVAEADFSRFKASGATIIVD
ncbi:MAG: hypothetical protein K2Q10_08635, partial [Rhodospirillales bacterium]|nr:hypothetical protein [Rhodospirillales bacterium]